MGLEIEHLATVVTPDHTQVIEIDLQYGPARQALTGISDDLYSATLEQTASLTVLMHLMIDQYFQGNESLDYRRLVKIGNQEPPAQ